MLMTHRIGAVVAAWITVQSGFPAVAGTMSQRAAVVARALSYEQTLLDRTTGDVAVGIVYSGGSEESGACAEAWREAWEELERTRVQSRAIRVFTHDLDELGVDLIVQNGPTVIVACTLDAPNDAAVRAVARDNDVLTVANERSQVEAGMAIGVFETAGRMGIMVNLRACSAEGVSFSSQLLNLAETLR